MQLNDGSDRKFVGRCKFIVLTCAFGGFKIRGQIIHTVTYKYADDIVLLAKKENVLQDIIDKLIEIGLG